MTRNSVVACCSKTAQMLQRSKLAIMKELMRDLVVNTLMWCPVQNVHDCLQHLSPRCARDVTRVNRSSHTWHESAMKSFEKTVGHMCIGRRDAMTDATLFKPRFKLGGPEFASPIGLQVSDRLFDALKTQDKILEGFGCF
jgi:hypothetical protein